MYNLTNEAEKLAFAQRAAVNFAENPKNNTYSDKEIEPGCYFAIRWGLGNDCVVVIKLDGYEDIVNYENIITKEKQ